MPQPTPQRPGGPSGCRRPAAPGAGVEVVVKGVKVTPFAHRLNLPGVGGGEIGILAFDDVSFFLHHLCMPVSRYSNINQYSHIAFVFDRFVSFFLPPSCLSLIWNNAKQNTCGVGEWEIALRVLVCSNSPLPFPTRSQWCVGMGAAALWGIPRPIWVRPKAGLFWGLLAE